jgi:CRP/FNR family cyclic AMP-dependent transcriptional regulator
LRLRRGCPVKEAFMAIATASLDFERYGRSPKPPAVSPELSALQACPLFSSAPPNNLQILAQASTLRSIARGGTVAAEGSPVPHALLVVRGRVRAVRRAANGREIAVEIFRAGDLIADGVLSPAALVNDWEAIESTALVMIPREALLAYVRGAPELALALAAQLLGRLDRSKELAVGLALADVQARVVAALVALGRQDGVEGPEGLLIRQRPTQQEIANQIGACRETVSRTVSDLVRRGLVTPRGRSLVLARQLFADAA